MEIKSVYDKALEESEKAKPSSDPAYWSKRSCNRCHGRGIIGKITTKVETNTFVMDYLCECAESRFRRWRDSWVKEYLKSDNNSQNVDNSTIISENNKLEGV